MSQYIARQPQPLLDVPKQIVNRWSTSGWSASNQNPNGGKQFFSGAMPVANVLTPIISVTGAGVISYLMLAQFDATSRQYRIQLLLDGVTVFDSTSAASQAVANRGASIIGSCETIGNVIQTLEPVAFRSSFVLNVSSNIVEAANAFVSEARYRLT